MKLDEWLSQYPKTHRIHGDRTEIEVTAVVADSREATPGALFVAIAGLKDTAITHIPDALERGATVVVTDREMWLEPKATVVQVADVRHALAHLAQWVHNAPGLRLVGVTGTNGKTTTTWLIRAILQAAGRKPGLIGTIEYDLCGTLRPATHTTPDAMSLAALFTEMRKNGATDAVMEVSSHALAQQRVDALEFDASVFTNLTQDHLDYHKTMWDYFSAKRRLFAQSRQAVINVDDPWGRKLKEGIPTAIGFGIDRQDAIQPLWMKVDRSGMRIGVATPVGQIEISTSLTGRHNVYNLLSAIGAALALSIPVAAIVDGIASVKAVPGRFEAIDAGQDFSVYVDYAHTQDALARFLEAVAALSPKRIITVFGCGGDRDRGKRFSMGVAAAQASDWIIVTSDNPRSETPQAIIDEIIPGILAVGKQKEWSAPRHEIIPDRRAAIARAIEMAEAGDAVVIAGKGHETVQIIGTERLPFDDRQVAREALASRLGQPLSAAA